MLLASLKIISIAATRNATTHCQRTDFTVVLGSVIMKKMKSWYIGPVSGATSARNESPTITLLSAENTMNEITYVSVMWNLRTRQVIRAPKIQTMIIGQMSFPH